MEGWERELQQLKNVDAPASTRSRIEAGPTGDGMPPVPNRGQRVAAGVVACLVFLLGAALLVRAFSAPTEVAGPAVVDPVVFTFEANDGAPSGSMASDEGTVEGNGGSFTWTTDGSSAIADTFGSEFEFTTWTALAPGSPIEVEGDAREVVGQVDTCCDRSGFPEVLEPLDLVQGASVPTEPGRYVLEFAADWPEGNRTFYFPIRIAAEATSEPDVSSLPTPTASSTMDPTDVTDRDAERFLTGSSWQLAGYDDVMLDLLEAPTLIFGAERIGGSTGCNRYGSDVWGIEDGRLVLGETAMTLVLCPGETDAVEENFLAVISGEPPLVNVDGFTLTLSTDDRTANFERIDVDHGIVGSFLDCAVDDRVDVRLGSNAIMEPAPPAYFTVNLPWIEPTDELRRIAGSPELDESSRWIVVRDGLVVAEVDYPDLTGIACPSAGA